MLVLSKTSAAAWLWLPGAGGPVVPVQITLVGYPMTLIASAEELPIRADGVRFARQSFLGPEAQAVLGRVRIGIVGLGGGGSHIAQQLAHVGMLHPRAFDGDTTEDTNLNRLIGARATDVNAETPKVEIVRRLYEGLLPSATPVFYGGRWQERPQLLRRCDIVIGCVDTFAGRHELDRRPTQREASSRRLSPPLVRALRRNTGLPPRSLQIELAR
jgi:molybdopterin/thiamine biosynthesis adenylyltransferase